MGIDAAYFRNDRTLGIVIGNFANEMSSLYVSQGRPLQFTDEAIATGLGPPSRQWLKFGTLFFDYDLDGRLDLLTANGHLEQDIAKVQSNQHYEQPPQLFWNCGPGSKTEFVAVPPAQCGADFARPLVGRGCAFADIDGDGDLDIVLTSVAGPPRLLRNDQKLGHHWLRFKLIGTRCNRDAIGARVERRSGRCGTAANRHANARLSLAIGVAGHVRAWQSHGREEGDDPLARRRRTRCARRGDRPADDRRSG